MSGDAMIDYDGVTARTTLSRSTVARLVVAGQFPRPTKVGGRTLFYASEVADWIEQQKARRVGPAAGVRTAALR